MENAEKNCCVCGNKISLLQVQEKWICENCLKTANESLVSPWKDSLEKLIVEFFEACNKCLLTQDSIEIHDAKILAGKIRSVLGFLGVPKKHPLFLNVRKISRILNKIRETDVLLDEFKNKNDENKVYNEMVKLFSIKRQKLHNMLLMEIPTLLNDEFIDRAKIFLREELIFYIVSFDKERVLHKYEASFNELLKIYSESSIEKDKKWSNRLKSLHSVRKRSKSLRYIYSYLNEIFEDLYLDKVTYFKNIQRQLNEVVDLEDRLVQLKANDKKIDAPKSEIKAVKKSLKTGLLQHLAEIQFSQEEKEDLANSH
jgi:CHAD domain-containing protein